MEIRRIISECNDELRGLRRDFHQYPELGFREFRTRDIVRNYLNGIGIETTSIAETGVIGLLSGNDSGKTILLRADMDALPVEEETGLTFSSCNRGVMHACGHDGHTAMLLVAAKVLSRLRDRLRGNVKFAFQPNEEDAGAYLMIEQGILENPTVDASYGCHLWSQLESGCIDVRPGPVMAASHYFFLDIKGKGGHAGFVHESVDPIFVASAVIQAIQAIQSREVDALNPLVVMFTEAHAGSNTTIVPEKMRLSGSIRVLYEDGEDDVRARFERIVHAICQAHRAEYELSFKVGNHLLANDENMAAMVAECAEDVTRDRSRVTARIRTMAGEDFASFAKKVPSVFAFLGSRNEKKGIVYPHHHPRFNIDEEVLPAGVELYVRTALRFLDVLI